MYRIRTDVWPPGGADRGPGGHGGPAAGWGHGLRRRTHDEGNQHCRSTEWNSFLFFLSFVFLSSSFFAYSWWRNTINIVALQNETRSCYLLFSVLFSSTLFFFLFLSLLSVFKGCACLSLVIFLCEIMIKENNQHCRPAEWNLFLFLMGFFILISFTFFFASLFTYFI